jgi:uncharacterized protein
MTFLIASVAVLAVGPLTYYFAERSHWAIRVLEAVVVIAVGALLLLHILPETIAQVGWIALVPMVLGLLGPTFVERALGSIERQAHIALVLLVLCGLGIHALMDGVALVLPTHEEGLAGLSLPIVVVLHRIPVSLLIWWLLRPSYGLWAATLALCIEGLGAVVGFFAAHALVTHVNSPVVGFVQAFVAGSMLHVMVDRHHHGVESPH